tara:strand:+ start:426 stop:1133 length:708 start_codon:yes stop_codon:yes gene_type:complete
MRQIVLDTETTGLDPAQGHKVIEIGCVELVNRKLTGNHFHVYINPLREIEAAALEIHGITNTFLADKPLFADVAESFVEFVSGAELVIHNAPFDIGFLNHELAALKKSYKVMSEYCSVLDTLVMARKKHPGQKNNLDALCKRYMVDNTQRELHGALLDAEILADVYLMMTGGQSSLSLGYEENSEQRRAGQLKRLSAERKALKIIRATDEELSAHDKRLKEIDDSADAGCMWLKI